MILWVWLQFAQPRLIFFAWSYPTCCVASLLAGPVGCISYNLSTVKGLCSFCKERWPHRTIDLLTTFCEGDNCLKVEYRVLNLEFELDVHQRMSWVYLPFPTPFLQTLLSPMPADKSSLPHSTFTSPNGKSLVWQKWVGKFIQSSNYTINVWLISLSHYISELCL